jgi:hypothetical protein
LGRSRQARQRVLFVDLPLSGDVKGRENGTDRAGQAEAGEAKIEGRSYDLSEAVR